jgi:hypothetical protein
MSKSGYGRLNGGLSFPGSRAQQPLPAGAEPTPNTILFKTAGNALQAISKREIQDNDELVAVSCPEGVSAGDRLRVLAPDGSGREVETVVPEGICVGKSFLVRFPTRPESFHGNNTNTVFVVGTPASPTERPVVASPDYGDIIPVSPPVAIPVDDSNAPSASAVLDDQGQDLVLVKVPKNVRPGDKLVVSTDDGRTVEAVVPSGADEFYVRVPPSSDRDNSHQESRTRRPPQPEASAQIPVSSNTQDDASLLLVHVPDGSRSGETIRVTTADGRIIEAVIPPGPVKEFHVRLPTPPMAAAAVQPVSTNNESQPFGALKSCCGITD